MHYADKQRAWYRAHMRRPPDSHTAFFEAKAFAAGLSHDLGRSGRKWGRPVATARHRCRAASQLWRHYISSYILEFTAKKPLDP